MFCVFLFLFGWKLSCIGRDGEGAMAGEGWVARGRGWGVGYPLDDGAHGQALLFANVVQSRGEKQALPAALIRV